MGKGKSRGKGKRNKSRRVALKFGTALAILLAFLGAAGDWFVHHPQTWIDEQPAILSAPFFGSGIRSLTSPTHWTGPATTPSANTTLRPRPVP